MSAIIKQLTDKEYANDLLPITNTKAVYDDAGNRLDNTLARIQNGVLYNESATLIRNDNDARVTNVSGAEFRPIFASDFVLPDGKTFATKNTISDAYNPSKTYAQGEFCIYNNTLWKSKVSNNVGNTPAEGSYWTATNVGKEMGIKNITSQISLTTTKGSVVTYSCSVVGNLFQLFIRFNPIEGTNTTVINANVNGISGASHLHDTYITAGTLYYSQLNNDGVLTVKVLQTSSPTHNVDAVFVGVIR